MKNINEEVNYMKYLLGYQKGVVISEQETAKPTQQVAQPNQKTVTISANVEIPKMVTNTSKVFSNILISTNYIYQPAVFFKYSDSSAIIVGKYKGTPSLITGSLPANNDPNKISDIMRSQKIEDPSAWNEYQWVTYLNSLDSGTFNVNGIAQFLANVKQQIGGNFGTLTPDKLGPAVKNDPTKLKKYQQAIAASGINPNFKKV